MYCLYQCHGALLGVGESPDQARDEAEHYVETAQMMLMDELGYRLGADDAVDLTTIAESVLEVTSELYLRRCSLALYEETYTAPDRSTLAYTIGSDGVVRLATEGKGGSCDAQAPPH
jgi:hypothetical protein